MATGAQVGVRRGLGCLLGVGLGMAVMMFVVAFGLGSVILGAPTLLRVMKWCGAAFLLWLAWKIATARPPGERAEAKPVGFAGAAAFQWINPKSWLVCASAAATFLDRQAGSALGQSAALGLVFLAACLPSCLPWLAFGAAMQRVAPIPARLPALQRRDGRAPGSLGCPVRPVGVRLRLSDSLNRPAPGGAVSR